jgi:hypothetical protein
MEKSKETKTITLVEHAFALPDSDKEFGMKIADHKLICSVLDAHLESVNDEICDIIVDKAFDKLAEVIKPIFSKLEDLETGQKIMQEDINILKSRNSIKSYIIRGAIYILIALFLTFIGMMFLFPWYQKHFTGFFERKQTENQEWVDYVRNMDIKNVTTRSIDYHKLTTIQQDSIHEENEKGLLKQIEERNRSNDK